MRIAVVVVLLARIAHAEATLVGPASVAGWEQWRVSEGAQQVSVYVQHDQRTLPLVVVAAGAPCAEGKQPAIPFTKRGDFQLAVVGCVGNEPRDARASALALVVRGLRTQPWVVRTLLAGHGDGADVAAAALRYLAPADVAALGFFASGGIAKSFEAISAARRASDGAAAQKAFEALIATPPTDATPLDDLVPSSAPVFVAAGTRDPAIDSADALVVELLRRNAHRPLRYVILDGADHDLRAADGSHGDELLAELVKWSTTPTGRTVETRSLVPGATLAAHPRASGVPAYWIVLALGLGVAATLIVCRRRVH